MFAFRNNNRVKGSEEPSFIYNPLQAIRQYIEDEISSRTSAIQKNYDNELEKIKSDYEAKWEGIRSECNNLYQNYHLSDY